MSHGRRNLGLVGCRLRPLPILRSYHLQIELPTTIGGESAYIFPPAGKKGSVNNS
jgi:hypothetical protein